MEKINKLERELVRRRIYLAEHEEDYESELTRMYWRGRTDGVGEAIDMLNNYKEKNK